MGGYGYQETRHTSCITKREQISQPLTANLFLGCVLDREEVAQELGACEKNA